MALSEMPALLGGPKACPRGPVPWPIADDDILHALQSAYADGSWGRYAGGSVERLENLLTQAFGVDHALTCGSGTFAVELALRALKVGPGDEVIMAAYDFDGNFLNIHAVGAMPVLVDVAPHNWNLAPDSLEASIGPATKAILVSHLHGGLVPMAQVMEIARRRHVPVIEDIAQTPGGTIENRPAGAWGDVSILSFGGSKLLTAGRGGALLTNRPEICQRARTFQKRGNLVCPLSELQAAVLIPQLAKLDERNRLRSLSVERLKHNLSDIPGLKPFANTALESQPAYYKLGFQFDAANFGLSRDRFVAASQAEGVNIDIGFRAHHVGRSPSRFRRYAELPEASRANAGAVVLHHPVLLESPDHIDDVSTGIRKIFAHRHQLST